MQSKVVKSFKRHFLGFSIVSVLIISAGVAGPAAETATSIPELSQEPQHSKSVKRIADHFTRSHYKKIEINDALSEKVFHRYLRSLDINKTYFLASDVSAFEKFKDVFDDAIRQGQLDVAYEIYMVNLKRRADRFTYALSIIKADKPFDYELEGDKYFYDREDAAWAKTTQELDEIWRQRVKYEALNLKMTDKTWQETQEILIKRYERAIKRLTQTNSEDVFQTIMNSFALSIEAHTMYLSPRRTDIFQQQMNLSLEGIGAVLRSEDDHTVIVSLVAGGPADKTAQIKPEDKIIAVAQENQEYVDVVGWRLDEVVELIKGPKGSVVKLQVLKGSSETKKINEVTITRDKVKLEDSAAKAEVYIPETGPHEGQKLGVIEIPSFYHNLHADVIKELTKLKEENVEGIIVDLRGNGGGSLQEAILLSGLFIEKGPVVQVRYENGRISVDRDTDGIVHYAGPLTVMVDRYSASSSEIFAAAMQDYNRAVIIGEQTFGKGTVQVPRGLSRTYDLDANPLGSVTFTIGKFYRINGSSTQHKGVKPDIMYPTPIDPAEWGESKEENALPYDQIRKANYSQLGRYDGIIDVLAAKHAARVMKDPEFNYIFNDIAEYNKDKDKDFISLVESERLETKIENDTQQLQRINERLERMGLAKIASLNDDLPEALNDIDPFLAEAANITFDIVDSGSYALNMKK